MLQGLKTLYTASYLVNPPTFIRQENSTFKKVNSQVKIMRLATIGFSLQSNFEIKIDSQCSSQDCTLQSQRALRSLSAFYLNSTYKFSIIDYFFQMNVLLCDMQPQCQVKQCLKKLKK